MDYHTPAVSHIDAVRHIGYRDELFGGVASKDAFSLLGSNWAAVTAMQSGIITRGVLIDMPVLRHCSWLAPSTAVRATTWNSAERQLGYVIGPGDAVLLRSGHGARRAALGPGGPTQQAPISSRRDAVARDLQNLPLRADEENDPRPSSVTGVPSPIHILTIAALGIPLMDNLDLEALSKACATAGRYEFRLMVAPLAFSGGTGSP